MCFEIKYKSTIVLNDIPIQWIPKIELFYPDLPQFPIIYIHSEFENERIYGFPVSVNYNIDNSKLCTGEFTFLCNKDLEQNSKQKNFIKTELAERIGLSDKITSKDIEIFCNGNHEYEAFFNDLWSYLSKSYGNSIPYGQFYEEIYSIVRFVSAWQPKTGRQSEMRMLYNFMSIFGQPVILPEQWDHLEFYLIPNYTDSLNSEFKDFIKFQILYNAIKKVWDTEYSTGRKVLINNIEFNTLKKAWPQNKDKFMIDVSEKLYNNHIISSEEKFSLDRLVDAFNRNSWRASYFISSFILINNINYDYKRWTKDFFISFYNNGHKLKGYSQKVIACFLQQGFKNVDVIPIDTWIKTFYEFPLNIQEQDEFLDKFNNMGKLERIIWLSSQSNKTNMKNFFNLLWCQRYGVTGNSKLRGINPIACYECALNKTCVGFHSIKNKNILLNSKSSLPSDKTSYSTCDYICDIINLVPKKIYICTNNDPVLIDEFSGFILNQDNAFDKSFVKDNPIVTVEEFIENLPEYKF